MAHSFSTIDELGSGPGFRKVRHALGVTAFGCNVVVYPPKEIGPRLPDRSFHRYAYRDFVRRTRQLAVALERAGLRRGDRVATLCWNHYQHLEAYFGVPIAGGVVHTLNLRLHPSDLS